MPTANAGVMLAIAVPAAILAIVSTMVLLPKKRKSKAGSEDQTLDRKNLKGVLKVDPEAMSSASLLLPERFLMPEMAVDDRNSPKDANVNLLSTSGRWLNDVVAQGMRSSVANRLLELIMSPLEYWSPAEDKRIPAQSASRPLLEQSSADQGVPARIQEAKANSQRSIYYTSIQGEVQKCKKNKKWWKDPDFPHEDSSISSSLVSKNHQSALDLIKSMGVIWANPMEFCVTRRSLLRSSNDDRTWLIDDDVDDESSPVQLVSSIDHYASGVIVAALQSNPLLCDALIDRTYESHGILGVSLRWEGRFQMVWVDLFFPCSNYNKNDSHLKGQRALKLVFGSGETNVHDTWSLVIEKACAKLCGGFLAIYGVEKMSKVLSMIDNGDDMEIVIGDELRKDASSQSKSCQKLFKQISDGLSNQRSLVLAGSCASAASEGGNNDASNIPRGQTFIVLEAVAAGNERLLLLRSPFGSVDGSGKWKGRPEQWKQIGDEKNSVREAASRAQKGRKDVFWLSLEEFVQNFDGVVIHTFELSSAEQKRRAEIMSAFSGFPQQLKPGLSERQRKMQAKAQADQIAAELIAEEERTSKRQGPKMKKKRKGTR